jgi:mannose-1-phosphate guanylyltransferase
MKNNNYAVIMAGGIGSRFWPLSTTKLPKQFLDILGVGKTLLQITAERLLNICPAENILVVTNKMYDDIVKQQLPQILQEHILLEPQRRNTAPCIAYANYIISKKDPDANILVAASDHLILNESEFISKIKAGIDYVSNNSSLLTLGIKPSRPDTGYGYIQADYSDTPVESNGIRRVKTFTEKPDLETAKFFLKTGEFSWNSGIFLWSLRSIDAAFRCYLPEVPVLFEELDKYGISALDRVYSACPNVSIDYGIMEKASNVFVSEADFGWSDLGTWGSLYENTAHDKNGNSIISGEIFCNSSSNNVIRLPKGKIGVIEGLNDYIVVDSGQSLLICPKSEEQRIKLFVNDIKLSKGEDYA